MILERCHWHYFGTKNPTEYTESAEYAEFTPDFNHFFSIPETGQPLIYTGFYTILIILTVITPDS